MLFESLSSGLSQKTKFVAWQCVAQAVNGGGGQQRSLKDVKKWSDLKLQSKKRVVFSLHGLQYLQEALCCHSRGHRRTTQNGPATEL